MNRKRAYILFLLMAASAVIMATETVTEIPTDSLGNAQDSIIVSAPDTVTEEPDPEWYVLPLVREPLRAPKRMSAASCDIDSIQTYNADSVLESVTVYEYGDTTRTMTWTVNADGTRYGSSRTEKGTNGNITFSATYDWDAVSGTWKGTTKEEHTYAGPGGKETLRTLYDWVNNAWTPLTKYTWTFDADGRETQFTTYERNASGQLAYSKQRIREYNAAGSKTLEIQYTAHNGTEWSAGTKDLWEFNAAKLQTLHEKYTLSNSNWTITLREIKGYDAAGNNDLIENYALQSNVWKGTKKEEYVFFSASKKTSSIAYTWYNGAWANSTKETWEFNGPSSKQTLHEKYSWANNDWQITLQENTGYDAAGNNTSIENYSYTNGVQKGTKKEEYTFNTAKKKIYTYKYKWLTDAWVYSTWAVTDFNSAGSKTEVANYTWKDNGWVGSGARTLWNYTTTPKTTEEITQLWSNDIAEWANAVKSITTYSGSKTIQTASYKWQDEEWLGTSRNDYHYNAAGQNDTIKTYTKTGTEWIYSNRTVKNYNAAGTEIMVHNAQWDGEKWVMTSMTRTDEIKDASGRVLLNAKWRCSADSIWIGVSKDTASFSATGQQLYEAHYTSWANNNWVPSYKIETKYYDFGEVEYTQRMDWSNSEWRGRYRNEYVYENGKQISSAQYNGWNADSKTWIGTIKTDTEYNIEGRMASLTTSLWGTDNWRASQKTLFTYDVAGHETNQIVQNYTNDTWTNSIRYEKEYKGSTLIKDNSYEWANNDWRYTSRSEKTYDGDAQAKLRRDITGYWSKGALQSFSDKHYYYACDPKFTIRFVNDDNTPLISDQVLLEGRMPSVPANPTKAATAQYTYTFAGWDKEVVPVVGDETYTATFSNTINKYTITFKNGEETLQSTEVEYGATPTAPTNPTKDATAQYTYTFKAWNPAITSVTSEAIYTAEFDSTTNKYTIVFKNGEEVLQSIEVEYGIVPTYSGTTPTKQATAEYTYTFTGWDIPIATVTKDTTYTATFSSTINKYTITFNNEDGTELKSTEVEYGTMPTAPTAPAKNATAQYTYTFKSWDNEIASVIGEATYTAIFDSTVNKYLITFKNGEETLLSTEVEYGTMPTAPAEPTKNATAQYTYTFKGWDIPIATVTKDTTYTATFSSTVNKYLITFKNEDGTELQSTEVAYGTMPTAPAEPTKNATAQYTYTFKGWDNEIASVIGEATYIAIFDSTVNKYLITFKNDETTLQSTEVAYGVTPAYTGTTPVKQGDAQYTYTFKSWDNEIASVIGEATYIAIFDSTVNKYLITFKNDETTLQSTEVAYGVTPAYTGTTPVKQGDAQYTYTFKGWDIPIATVTKDTTYTATFSSTINKYTITFNNEDGTEISRETLEYGAMPTAPEEPTKAADAQHTYAFAGWDKEITAVTGDATYTATYTSTQNGYLITWLSDDGSLIEETTAVIGTTPAHAEIYKERTAQYTFTFKGWSPVLEPVSGNATYTAVFDTVVNTYTVTFYLENGTTILDQVTVPYGEIPATTLIPSEPMEEHYYYTFAGWSPEVVPVTGEASYTAVFTRVPKEYTITFRNYNNALLQTVHVPYGKTPEYTGEEPARQHNAQYTYIFTGWSPEITAVTGDATYTAVFDAEVNSYLIVFLDEDGTELDRQTVKYGVMPTYSGETPVKAEDEQYIYTFKGWSPALTRVTHDATYQATYTAHDKSQALNDVQGNNVQCTKVLRDNQIYILRGNKTYTLQGVEVEE